MSIRGAENIVKPDTNCSPHKMKIKKLMLKIRSDSLDYSPKYWANVNEIILIKKNHYTIVSIRDVPSSVSSVLSIKI